MRSDNFFEIFCKNSFHSHPYCWEDLLYYRAHSIQMMFLKKAQTQVFFVWILELEPAVQNSFLLHKSVSLVRKWIIEKQQEFQLSSLKFF